MPTPANASPPTWSRGRSRFATLALAAAWVHGPALRVLLEYDRNWNPLGRYPSGFPRTLGRDALTLRGQLVY